MEESKQLNLRECQKSVAITFTIGKEPGVFLMNYLQSFAWNLNINLQDEKQGEIKRLGNQGQPYLFENGIFKVVIEKTLPEIVQLYVTPFVKTIRKCGHRLIYNIGELI